MQATTRPMSQDLLVAIEHAQREAGRRHGNYVDVEHLLLGLLRHRSGVAQDIFRQHDVNTQAMYDSIADAVGMERPEPAPVKGFSRWAKAAFDRAAQEADTLSQRTLNSGHLLLALMAENDGAVRDVIDSSGLTPDHVRTYLREHVDHTPGVATSNVISMLAQKPAAPPQTPTGPKTRPEVVVVPFRPRRKTRRTSKPGAPATGIDNRLWIAAAIGLLIAYILFVLPGGAVFTFAFVLIGWVFSVTLHEFSHALVAYWGGDYTVKDKGYLSFNPLKYTHPMLSIGLPLLFLALGGIGLPGGAVYIERHRLKNKWWGAAVSAAGPAANLLLVLVLAAPFYLGLVDLREAWEHQTLWGAVAFLAMLQVTAVLFNLLPIPPLDGFGIIEPLLDERTRFQVRQFGAYGLLIIFIILWTPLGNGFWDMIFDICRSLDIPGWLIVAGWDNFMFWRESPQ
ncbi:MAG: site-2 protease family protein [Anaerolineae bacterium]|nr:site-2 protease family protein [Anaerolineae bacterium]